jgi:hypothetical protein
MMIVGVSWCVNLFRPRHASNVEQIVNSLYGIAYSTNYSHHGMIVNTISGCHGRHFLKLQLRAVVAVISSLMFAFYMHKQAPPKRSLFIRSTILP